MSDEAKCGVVLALWIIVMNAGLLSETAVGYVIAAAVTVITLMAFAYDKRISDLKGRIDRTSSEIKENFIEMTRSDENGIDKRTDN